MEFVRTKELVRYSRESMKKLFYTKTAFIPASFAKSCARLVDTVRRIFAKPRRVCENSAFRKSHSENRISNSTCFNFSKGIAFLNLISIFSNKTILAFAVFALLLPHVHGKETSSASSADLEILFPQMKGILAKSDPEKVSSFQRLRQDVLNGLNKEYGKPFLAIENFSEITSSLRGTYHLFYVLDFTLVTVVIQNSGTLKAISGKLNPEEIANIKAIVKSILENPEEGTKITENDPFTVCWLFTIQQQNKSEYTHIPFLFTSSLKKMRNDENKTVRRLLLFLNELSKKPASEDEAELAKQQAFENQVWTFFEAHEKRTGLNLYAPEKEQEERKMYYMKIRDEEMKTNPPPPVDLKLDKETAIKIAETVLVKQYGEGVLEQRPWKVTERDDHFVIIGTLFKDRPIARGGVADIVIRKTDGRVMSIMHGR